MFRTHFYGQEISDYGRTYGRVDYHALAKSFDAVLCNSILGYREGFEDWELIQGYIDNSEAIEEKRAELEELERTSEELTEEKEGIETNLEDLEEADTNTSDLLDRFESFEYEANELSEMLKYCNFEARNTDGERIDIDSDAIEREIDCIDFWQIRSFIEDHQSEIEESKEALEERLEEIEEELEELNKSKEELEGEIEELELEDTTETEVFQYYIISDNGAKILEEQLPSELVWYNAELDLYVWGVTHWGTSWDYVLTSIPCETYEEQREREEAEAKAEAERTARAEAMTEEERVEAEAEQLEELLELWDTSEEPTEGETIEVEEEAEELTPMGWDAVMVGDIVIGTDYEGYYSITREGWKGKITSIDFDATGEVESFGAIGIGNSTEKFGDLANVEFSDLEPQFFDLFEGTEGGEH